MSPKTTPRRKTARKAAKTKRPAARRKTAAKKVAKKVAGKAVVRKTAKKAAPKRSASQAAPRKSSAKTAARKKSAAKPARRASSKAASRPAPPQSPAKRSTAAPKKPAPRKRAVTPDIARQHFLEILEAKQQRVKQGPAYPAPNAFTGRPHDAGAGGIPSSSDPGQDSSPDVEATYGEGEFASGRGNQGMRGQK